MDDSPSDTKSSDRVISAAIDDLLRFPKTLPPALSCLVYISNAFEAAGKVAAQVKITKIRRLEKSSTTRAIHTGGGHFKIFGSPILLVEIVPSNDPERKQLLVANVLSYEHGKHFLIILNHPLAVKTEY
ncbi:hypothetical protein PENTCL1PPCAC_21097 [Pristionchus entomophagus]|uniref:Uncharacterized protein n=1 Tax=Pristionchus entomophagus TaxID=358040 RepID=A0AAV5TX26_9BILA|nr:hypothetical protein PENTCL1PPCAC_21097 [Pristionchus entomophagus]